MTDWGRGRAEVEAMLPIVSIFFWASYISLVGSGFV